MTDDTDSTEERSLDVSRAPETMDWIDDVHSDMLVVRRYDTDDILVGKQYYVIIRDETSDGRFIVSSIAHNT
jgi:hypothetical protein